MQKLDRTPGNALHQAVLSKIDALLKQLKFNTTDERVANATKQVFDLVSPIHADLIDRINNLQGNVRWEKFTIAFYGETNAGKSTIIETLRILLQEQTKLEERAAFRAREVEHGISETALTELAQAIENSRVTLDTLRDQADKLKDLYKTEQIVIKQELTRLRMAIDAEKLTASFWIKFIRLFTKTRNQIEYTLIGQKQRDRESTFSTERARLDAEINNAQVTVKLLEARLSKAHAMLESLAEFADGQIIGTGRSDYTLDTHAYEFHANEQRFEILDVPGIEGKEARVINSILAAVQGAHAVFYVTGKPSAPQTGDERKQGTLEKIRNHLGDQTEVWTIFNKRITNPLQLEKGDLLSQGERASLTVLDETMREHLGNNYQGYIALSALPAFLASANCLVPGSDSAHSREKFRSKLSESDLLEKSGFHAYIDWLSGSMVTDCEERIRTANVNKVRMAILAAADKIKQIQIEKVAPLTVEVQRDWDLVGKMLERAVGSLGPALQAHANRAIDTFASHVREQIYAQIDSGINNDDLKDNLNTLIKSEQTKLESIIPELMKSELERFQDDVTNILERFQRRVDELQDTFRSMGSPSLGAFDLHMKFDKGIKYTSLIGTLGGGLLMLWNPAGWVTLAIGGMTLLVSFVKAVRSFFSADYKKSQQRKAADENISRIVDRLHEAMKASHKQIIEIVKTRITDIATEIELSVAQIAKINSALSHVNKELLSVSTDATKFLKLIPEKEAA